MMSDYSTFTDLELNAEIARRLGWHIYTQESKSHSAWTRYHVLPPGIAKPDEFAYGFRSQKEAYATLGEVFNVASDANEALALWQDDLYFVLKARGGKWFAIRYDDDYYEALTLAEVSKAQPARAIAECWLMYQDVLQNK